MSINIEKQNLEYLAFLKDSSWYMHNGEGGSEEAAYLALGIAGEAGEFAGEIKKVLRKTGHGDKGEYLAQLYRSEHKVVDELGDVLWYFTQWLDQLGLSRELLMEFNTVKLYQRMLEMHVMGELPIDMPNWPFSHITFEEAKNRYTNYLTRTEAR